MTEASTDTGERLYEDGKHRRYSLLFAVNGGAFAVAKLLTENCDAILGNLTRKDLTVGMALFTAAMVFDIWTFGMRMRGQGLDVFGSPGRMVLGVLGALMCSAWLKVEFEWIGLASGLGFVVGVCALGHVVSRRASAPKR